MAGSFLTIEELTNVVQGATLIGSGGGGSPSSGMMVVDAISKTTDRVRFLSLDEVPDEAVVAAVCGFGSPDVLLKRGCVVQNFFAVETLERAIGKKIDYIVPYESGGYNSLTPFYAAAVKGIPVLDCDGTGRAVCEWYISMFEVHRIPMSPFALANEQGHAAVVYADNTIDASAFTSEKMEFVIFTKDNAPAFGDDYVGPIALDPLLAPWLEKWQQELKDDQARLAVLNQEALDIAALMEEAMNKKEAAYRTLNDDCRKLKAEYDAQLAAAAAGGPAVPAFGAADLQR